jgi:hypothetical protein
MGVIGEREGARSTVYPVVGSMMENQDFNDTPSADVDRQ